MSHATAYRAALKGWLVGAIAPPAALGVALVAFVRAMCGGEGGECSWGFELLLVVPVLVVCLLVTGPFVVRTFVERAAGAEPATESGSRAWRTAAVCGLGSVVLLYLGAAGGGTGFWVMLAVVTFGVPAIVAWRIA